jgi:hypothetical protein
MSGYIVRNGTWIEIGRMSPRQPQAFYPVTTPNLILRNNEILAILGNYNSLSINTTNIMGFV